MLDLIRLGLCQNAGRPVDIPTFDRAGCVSPYEDVTLEFLIMDHTSSARHQASEDDLVSAAFEKSWRFVETDPLLVHNAKELLRDRLRANLELSLRNGEQDILHIANSAIWKLSTELGRPWDQ